MYCITIVASCQCLRTILEHLVVLLAVRWRDGGRVSGHRFHRHCRVDPHVPFGVPPVLPANSGVSWPGASQCSRLMFLLSARRSGLLVAGNSPFLVGLPDDSSGAYPDSPSRVLRVAL